MNENIDKKEFICEICNYKSKRNFDLERHYKSQLHKRNGKPKENKCDLCIYIAQNHWTLKLHKISQHSTIEERQKQKYYCNICDVVFFSPLYKDKHISGSRHKKMVQNYNDINNI